MIFFNKSLMILFLQLGKVHPALKDGHVGGSFQRHQIRIFSFRV